MSDKITSQDNLNNYKKKLSGLAVRRMLIIQKFVKKLETRKLEEIRKDVNYSL